LAKKGRRYIELYKQHQAYQKRLQEHGIHTLQDFHKQIQKQGGQLETALKQLQQQKNKLFSEVTEKVDKVAMKLLLQQKNKLLLRGITKLIPGLNILSVALDVYDAYTLVRDVYQVYEQAQEDLKLQLEAELEATLTTEVDLTTLSDRVLIFFNHLGAGGKLAALTQVEADAWAVLLDFEFKTEEEFTRFLWAYGDYYEVHQGGIENNSAFVESVYDYRAEHSIIPNSIELEVLPPVNNLGDKAKATNFFDSFSYRVVKGDPTTVGSIVEIDATDVKIDKLGKEVQISFPNNNLLKAKVIQDLGDGERKIVPLENYLVDQKGFNKSLLMKSSVFVYNTKRQELTYIIKK
jgi:hypothetical protein